MATLSTLSHNLRDTVISAVTGLFSHGPTPLANTLDYRGDPGLLGPDSVSWRVLGDASVFIGGIRALVVQSAHAEVVAGVEDHSSYRTDPLGRLSRTSVYVTETTYGAMPEVEAAVQVVRNAHQPVTGTSERNLPYSASRPEMAAWVHNVLTDSFLAAYQAFGPDRLSEIDADLFVAEQTRIGTLLGADPLPETAKELVDWITNHPDRVATNAQANAIAFLRSPPLSLPIKIGYRLLFDAALTTIPADIRTQLDVEPKRRANGIGKKATGGLRWSLGASPSWQLALVRCDAPIPSAIFRQPLPAHVTGRIVTRPTFVDRDGPEPWDPVSCDLVEVGGEGTVKRMTYMSSFSRPLSHEEISQIGAHAARRNADDAITGVLLTLGSVFFQIIEGGESAIDNLYDRVLRDDRHTNIICLRTEAEATHRLFPDWSMNVIDLESLGGDVAQPLKLLLARMSEAQHIIGQYTQPAVSRIMMQGLNPLKVPLRKVKRLVLFTDMVAFSAISDRLLIEDVSELVTAYLETCSTAISKRGGEVTKFLGDGVMAYFDLDETDEALQSCVDIHNELLSLRANAPDHSVLRLLFSGFGLASGAVIEGSMGSSVKMDYTIIGEPVNTAARLEALSRSVNKPVLMTGAVARTTQQPWDISFVGEFDTGREDPTPVHALTINTSETTSMRSIVMRYLETYTNPD